MEEHPLCEQGDACPAIRLPLQQFEAMEKAFRWPVAPRQSEPCLYGRLLFVQIACKCLQFRLAMLLHFFQPPPQPISLALTQHMTKGLHLACRASQRLVGLDQPRPQDAERSCIFDGSTLAGSFNTRACPRTRVQTSSLSRGVELRLLSPAAREQSDPSNLSAFFGRRRQHTPQDFTLNASKQGLRDNDTMGKRVWKSEEKEGTCDSPNHLTPIRSSDPYRVAPPV